MRRVRRNFLSLFITVLLLGAIPGILCAIIFRSDGIPSNSTTIPSTTTTIPSTTTTIPSTTTPSAVCGSCTWQIDSGFNFAGATNGVVTNELETLVGATYWNSSGLYYQMLNGATGSIIYPGLFVSSSPNNLNVFYPFIDSLGQAYVFYYQGYPASSLLVVKILANGAVDTSYGVSGVVNFNSFTYPYRTGHVNPTTGVVAVVSNNGPISYGEIDVFSGTVISPYSTEVDPFGNGNFAILVVETGYKAGYSIFFSGFYGCFMNTVTYFPEVTYCDVASMFVDPSGDVYVSGSYSDDGFTTLRGYIMKITGGTSIAWTNIIPLNMGEVTVSANFIVSGTCLNVIVTNGADYTIHTIDRSTGSILNSVGFTSPDALQSATPYMYTAETAGGVRKFIC